MRNSGTLKTKRKDLFELKNIEHELEKAEDRLKESEITEANKKLLFDFFRDKKLGIGGYGKVTPIGIERQIKYCRKLPYLTEAYEKVSNKRSWREINEKTLKKLVEDVTNFKGRHTRFKTTDGRREYYTINTKRPLSNAAINDYFHLTRMIIRWMKKEKEPKLLQCIPNLEEGGRWARDIDTIKWKDLPKITKHAQNYRDRAIPWMLLDIPMEPESLLQMRIRDVKPIEYEMMDEDGKQRVIKTYSINIRKGKNKYRERTIELTDSAPYLAAWLRIHPRKDNPDAPLWVDQSPHRLDHPLKPVAMARMLSRLHKAAGVSFPSAPYFYRHSSATLWANSLPRHVLEHRGGWCPGSKAIDKHYIHLKAKDANQIALATRGMFPKQKTKKDLGIICKWCNTRNPETESACLGCNAAIGLTPDEEMAAVQIRKYIDEQMDSKEIAMVITAMREKLVKGLNTSVN
ncbi:MAG: tyrosine-type recombinase/integrase [Candidatus Lokiarchaeota archaeon]|nr:tyrosine-type recombinase/integrase [Candidatus Lokiarchaeota archaeon]